MKALEFQARMNPDRTLTIPPEVASQVQQEQAVRVILLIPESQEDRYWEHLTVEQFLKGYADSDALYNELSAG